METRSIRLTTDDREEDDDVAVRPGSVDDDLRPHAPMPVDVVAVFLALRPRLERLVANRAGSGVAADIVQDLYLRLPRIEATLTSEADARRYLLKMAVNASINHLQIEGRRAELLAGVTTLYQSAEPSPEDTVLTADELRGVQTALEELPEKCREMLFLSRVEGFTHAEIAARMGVSQSLVEKYLVKTLLHCKARLRSRA
jgi:RNA polymerase sigma factor (sigma-70 family)